jgi:hypothetical protein
MMDAATLSMASGHCEGRAAVTKRLRKLGLLGLDPSKLTDATDPNALVRLSDPEP